MPNFFEASAIQNHELTYREALFQLLIEAWPFIMTRAIELSTESSAAAYVGEENPAAASLIAASLLLLRSVFIMFLYRTSYETRQANANNQAQDVGSILKASWLFALGLGLISIPLAIYSSTIFKALGESATTSDATGDYLSAYALGIIFMYWSICIQQVMLGMKEPKHVLLMTVLTRPLSLPIGYALMRGELGLPKLGVAGMGYANALSYLLSFLVSMSILKVSNTYKNCNVFQISQQKIFEKLPLLIKHGVRIGLYTFVELGSLFLMAVLIGLLGNSALAAIQSALQYGSFLASITYAFATIMGILIIDAITKGNHQNAKMYSFVGISICLAIPLVMTIMFFSSEGLLIRPFSEDTSLARICLAITLLGQIADGLRNASSCVLSGYSDTQTAMVTNVVSMLTINAPLAFMFAFKLENAAGIVLARGLAILMSALVLFAKYMQVVNFAKPINAELTINSEEKNSNLPVEKLSTEKGKWTRFFRSEAHRETVPLLATPERPKFNPCIIL